MVEGFNLVVAADNWIDVEMNVWPRKIVRRGPWFPWVTRAMVALDPFGNFDALLVAGNVQLYLRSRESATKQVGWLCIRTISGVP